MATTKEDEEMKKPEGISVEKLEQMPEGIPAEPTKLLKRYEEAKDSIDLMEQDESTLAEGISVEKLEQTPEGIPAELPKLLKRYEEAKEEQDKSTLAVADYYYNEAKNYEKALEYYQDLYSIRENMYGADSPTDQMAHVLSQIRVSLNKLARYQEALGWIEKEIKISEKLPPSLKLAITYYNNAEALCRTGKKREAVEYYEKSEKIRDDLEEGETYGRAALYHSTGLLYKELSRFPKSCSYLEKAVAVYQKLLPGKRSLLASCLHVLADIRFVMADYQKAMTHFSEALDEYKKIYANEPNHDDIANMMYGMAHAYYRMQNYPAAEKQFRETIEIREAKYGKGSYHEKVREARNNLIMTMRKQKKEVPAEEMDKLLEKTDNMCF